MVVFCLFLPFNGEVPGEVGESASYEGAPSPWKYPLLLFHAVVSVDRHSSLSSILHTLQTRVSLLYAKKIKIELTKKNVIIKGCHLELSFFTYRDNVFNSGK